MPKDSQNICNELKSTVVCQDRYPPARRDLFGIGESYVSWTLRATSSPVHFGLWVPLDKSWLLQVQNHRRIETRWRRMDVVHSCRRWQDDGWKDQSYVAVMSPLRIGGTHPFHPPFLWMVTALTRAGSRQSPTPHPFNHHQVHKSMGT